MPSAAQPPWSQGRKAALALGAGICLTLCLLASLWAQKLDRRRLPLLSLSDGAQGARSRLCILQASNFSYGESELADLSFTFWSLYARHHKYHYFRMLDGAAEEEVPGSPGCTRKWQMVAALSNLLAQDRCELLLFLDLDVMITDFRTALLDLLDRWGFKDHHLIAQPIDPGFPWDTVHLPNGTDDVALNTGFMFLRDRPRTRELVQQWQRCPLVDKFCEWALDTWWSCEQGVYNVFIRPTLAPEELLILPCDEANGHEGSGYPGLPSNCSGRFVSHFWGWDGHKKATAAFQKQILRYAKDAMLYHASNHGQLQQFT